MIKFLTTAVVASAALAASPALAVDAFTVFDGTNGTGGFYYGSGVGTTLTDFDKTSTGSDCALAGGTCLTSSAIPGNIPFVTKGGTYPTVDYAGTTLAVHPYQDGTNPPASVFAAFQATTAGRYVYSLKLESIGIDTQNGVGYTLFTGNAFGTRALLPTYQSSATLTGSVLLAAGERFGAVIDANGGYGGDSTAVTFGVSVPEPAAWALMIGGFGMIGGAMRRRRTLVAA